MIPRTFHQTASAHSVCDSSLHSRPPSPAGNCVQNDGAFFSYRAPKKKRRDFAWLPTIFPAMKTASLRRLLRFAVCLVGLLAVPGWGAEPEWKTIFDGKTLAGWKATEFGGGGEAAVQDGQLHLPIGQTLTGVNFTGAMPKMSYELALEARLVEGGDFFCGLTFPYGETCCTFIVGGWGGATVGLSSIDGRDASENETTDSMKFEKDRWYKIRVRVTPAKIEAWIDDVKKLDVETKDKKISMKEGEIEASQPCGLATFRTHGAFRAIKLRVLGGAALPPRAVSQPLPPAAAPPAVSGEKIYAPKDLEALRAVLGQTVKVEGTILKQGESKEAKVRYLNFTENYKESLALVFMVEKGAGDFTKEKLTNYVGKKVQATGMVADYKGNLQIEISALDRIKLVP